VDLLNEWLPTQQEGSHMTLSQLPDGKALCEGQVNNSIPSVIWCHMAQNALPGLSWGDSSHWVETWWRALSRDSSLRWQNYTSHRRSLETLLLSRICHRWVWSFLRGLGPHAPRGTHRAVKSGQFLCPASIFPSPTTLAEVENILPLHITKYSPGWGKQKGILQCKIQV
jgi:hypothetical protein